MAKSKKSYKKLDDEAILAALATQITDSVGWKDSKLSRERIEVLDYYHGRRPKPLHAGNSKYVSLDVFDTVESMHAACLETFASGYSIVSFPPQGPEDVEPARIGSAYTDYVMFRQNDCYSIFSTAIRDGLLARLGTVKCYWDKSEDQIEEEFGPVAMADMDALIADPKVELQDYEVDDQAKTVSGTIVRTKNTSQVRIETVPPEELVVSAREKDPYDTQFIAQRSTRLAGDLMKTYGLSKEKIEKLPSGNEDQTTEQELQTRTDSLSLQSDSKSKEYQDQCRPVEVHECYIKLDVDGTGTPRLWKFIKSGDNILDREQVDRHPFKFFIPLPVPHTMFGSNFAMKVVPIQNARTTLIRGILDHTVITNNPRTLVVKGALVNPREMLENRQGGVVNITRPDGVFPFPQTGLNPFVFQTINLLDEDKESNTSVSKLSQGLNKDAISNQNSQGLVDNLVSLSQQRQKIIARNFANGFLIPLAIEIYRLVLENEDRQNIVDLAGNWVKIDVSKWIERKDCTTSLKLGYGEQEKESTKWVNIHKFLSSDPSIAPLYPLTKKFNVLKTAFEKEGCKNISDYLCDPTPGKDPAFVPPQPDPKVAAEVAELQSRAKSAEGKLAIQQQEFDWQRKMDTMQAELDKKTALLDLVVSQREAERKDFDSKTRAEVAHRELDIIESAPPSEVKQSNIVSPNS